MDQECFLMLVFQAVVHEHLHATLFHCIKLLWLVVQQAFDLRIACELLCAVCFLIVQDWLIHYFRADFLAVCGECCNCFQVFTFKLLLYAKMILLIFLLFRHAVILYMMKSIILLNEIKIVLSKKSQWMRFASKNTFLFSSFVLYIMM